MWADLVVFDPATIADEATYENPRQYPKGIRYVLVGGEVAVDDGKLTNTRAGRVLRHSTVSV
jgi:N-acyl-D-aspartate/D-glutamate deacylase